MNKKEGSLTIEASIALPAFVFAICVFIYFFQIINVHITLRSAAVKAAKEVSSYGYVMKTEEYLAQKELKLGSGLEIGERLLGITAGDLWFEKRVKDFLPDDTSSFSIIDGGYKGIVFWGSDVFDYEERVKVYMFYKIKMPFFSDVLPELPVVQKVVMKSYSGSLVEYINEDDGKDNEDGNVYVVRGSSRYHVYRTCFHINIQAIPSTFGSLPKRCRIPCAVCARGKKAGDNDTVYYTKSGTRYHLNPECGEITRNLVTMTLEEAKNAGYTECRDCEKNAGSPSVGGK